MESTATVSGSGIATNRHPIPPNLRLDSSLEEVPLHKVVVDISERGRIAIDLFNQYPFLPGLILKDAGIFYGMLSRRRFYELMGRPFSLDLFSRRPLKALVQVLDTQGWIFPAATRIVDATRQVLQRQVQLFYDPLIVQKDNQDIYLLDIHDLLLAQAKIHELALIALQNSQQALLDEKELAQITLQSIGDGVITTNAEGHIQSLNRIAEHLTGWPSDEALGQPLNQVFTCFDEEGHHPHADLLASLTLPEMVRPAARTGMLLARHGQERIIDYLASAIRDSRGTIHGAVVVLRDITHQRHLARQLEWQASHDALTGLTNRNEFEQILQETLHQARQIGTLHTFCYIDLDRFKVVNDSCGHLAGDELLRQISTLLHSQIRTADVLARLGGDEFGLLLLGCAPDQGEAIAEKIRQEIQHFRFSWQGQTFAIGASIGITLVDGSFPANEILQQGDTACYWAKHEGRNRVCHFQAIQGEHNPQCGMAWVRRLTDALKHNGFQLYRQKVVNPQYPNQAVHCELLLRLVDNEGSLHLPDAFLPTAERYNLMPDIDRWVIRNAFRAYVNQLQQPTYQGDPLCLLPCRFAINLSGASLNDHDLVDFIQAELVAQGVPPEAVCFEITETVAIANLTRASAIVRTLKELGCQFALDDFGSGVSSFTYLKTLPIDFLKIDGSFIKDVATDQVARVMVESIHNVGRAMGLKTIAEWVDNEATLQVLQEIGIDYVQGYFIDQPEQIDP